MILISKMIRDPATRWTNRLGLTIGLTFYAPKFWNCRTIRPERYRHPNCRWPHRHMSYKGYMYWTGPRRRYQVNYMGSLWPNQPSLFKVFEHGRYTRWLDNGLQNPVIETKGL